MAGEVDAGAAFEGLFVDGGAVGDEVADVGDVDAEFQAGAFFALRVRTGRLRSRL